MLPSQWYRTPLEYLSPEQFGINLHWSYYTRLAAMFHIRVFSRPVTSRPWDRFPSDTWLCPSLVWIFPACCVTVIFSIMFIAGWNFYFPTPTERTMWRVFSVYHATFSIYGAAYYLFEVYRSKEQSSTLSYSHQQLNLIEERHGLFTHTGRGWIHRPIFASFLEKWHETLPNQDPEDRISLRVLIPVTITCALYVICRLFIYAEDFVSLREQQSGVYNSTSLFVWAFGP
jgi:hypothetical protein